MDRKRAETSERKEKYKGNAESRIKNRAMQEKIRKF